MFYIFPFLLDGEPLGAQSNDFYPQGLARDIETSKYLVNEGSLEVQQVPQAPPNACQPLKLGALILPSAFWGPMTAMLGPRDSDSSRSSPSLLRHSDLSY